MKKMFTITLPLLILFSGASHVCSDENSEPSKIQVFITNGDRGTHQIDGSFTVEASSMTAWKVLTDYDHMDAFVSSIKSSRVLKNEKEDLEVEQVMTGKAGIFKKSVHLRLKIEETPQRRITFLDTSYKSFKSYFGFWEILTHENQLQINYQLEATPDFFSPNFIAVKAFRNNVLNLLEQVRTEIIERSEIQQ